MCVDDMSHTNTALHKHCIHTHYTFAMYCINYVFFLFSDDMYWFHFQANKSALLIAAANGHKEIVKFLVERHNFVLTEEDSVSSLFFTVSAPCLQ